MFYLRSDNSDLFLCFKMISMDKDTTQLTNQIENCNSKVDALICAEYIVKNPELLDFLFEIIKKEEHKKNWRAAWILDHVYASKPQLLNGYENRMIQLFMQTKSSSIQRIIGKLLSFSHIKDKADGDFLNKCFELLIAAQTPVAVKVHAMQLIFNISDKYPELKPELKIVIEENIPHNSVGFKSRANKILKKL